MEGIVAEHRHLKWTSSLREVDTTAVQPGDVIAGRFEIDGRAGAGGMGEVFRARDRSSGRDVAVKVLLERRLDDEVRFTREAAVLSELRHPGIVEYVTSGETPSGQRYLVMEWLAGEDLSVRLARGALGVDEALALGARVAEALAAAHARGVVHRDLKPSNIFLVERDVTRAKVLDFGIARRGDAKTITRAGALLGTPGYMAPEQARSGRDVDARADVFALGCVLFECLTGTPAFLGDDLIAILAKVLAEEAPRVRERCPQVPEALEQLVSRMLAKEPEERPGDAAAVAEELEALRGAQRRPSVHTRRSRSTQPPSLTGGERRILSVVLLGKQPPADDGAPTLCEAELSSVQGELRRTAADHGGLLEVLVDGTAIVTLARTTQVPTDQAAQAARCALALRAVSRDRPVVLATGRSEVTGRLCAGDAIDRAARMLAAPPVRGRARPVAIDEVTAGLLDARFEVVETDAGLELRAERELAEGARTLLGKATACVGRDWEIATLEALLQECFEEPLARAVLITAPAGMGKSRIASELTGRLRQRGDEVAIWTGRVDSLRAGSSFGLLGQVLRSALSLRDGEPLEARRDKIRARVAGSTPAADQRGIAAFLGEIVDTPFADEESVALRTARQNAQLMSDQLRKAWLDFLRAEVAQRPVLLVLEDLHWGDQPTVSFLDAALRDLRAMPWMVLALARPEVHEAFPRLWAERQTQEIRLKELPRKACERLVRQALGASIGREMLERIVALAGGHAFYLEELIRAVAEGRGEALPETVLAMVEARLSRLDPEARRLLRAASVFGEVFWEGGVSSLLGGAEPPPSADAHLARLVDLEVLVALQESRFPGEREFAFRHALLREGAYAMLTEADMALGHRIAGAWLEQRGETDPMLLAGHFERGGDRARAADFYLRAADQAHRSGDVAAAAVRARQGLACGGSEELRSALLGILCEALVWCPQTLGDAAAYAEEVMRISPRGSSSWSRGAMAMLASAFAARRIDEYMATIQLLQETTPAPGAARLHALAIVAAVSGLDVLGRVQRADEAMERLDAGINALDRQEPLASLVWTVMSSIRSACIAGEPWRGLDDANRAMDLARAQSANHESDIGIAHLAKGMCLWHLGAPLAAEQVLSGLAPFVDTGLAVFSAFRRFGLAWLRADRGAHDEARQPAVELRDFGYEHRVPLDEGRGRWALAEVSRRAGDLEGAEREITAALQLLAEASPMDYPGALGTLSALRRSQGRAAEALAAAEEALARVEDMGGACGMFRGAFVRLAHAEALHATGDRGAARAAIATARAHLLAIVHKIADPSYKKSFLENVPENTRTVALARAWLGEPAEAFMGRS
ncbi:protein kinase domain-containing protein [Sorangium sp. So ce385]|uniref:protein kinase domain-containing protein n=1 Tax=Sorangium sp. So ce385 TaxID=3133308 RepID=UPI003F5B9D84